MHCDLPQKGRIRRLTQIPGIVTSAPPEPHSDNATSQDLAAIKHNVTRPPKQSSPRQLNLVAFFFHPVKIDSSQRGPFRVKVAPPKCRRASTIQAPGRTRSVMTRHIPIRVFLLSGSQFLREALRRVLGKTADILVVGAHPYSADAPVKIIESTCDVLLIDSISVLALESQIPDNLRCSLSQLKVVIIEVVDDKSTLSELAGVHVMGYLSKETAVADVISAIRVVATDQAAYPPRLSKMRRPSAVSSLVRSVSRDAKS
jgi:hypothetical protein